MKREDAYIGAEVYTDDGPLYLFKVIELPDENDKVKVELIKCTYGSPGSIETYHLDSLFLYDPRALKLAAGEVQGFIDEAKTAFETAFAAMEKIKEYQGNESNRITKYDLETLGLISMKELEDTVEGSGWSSSSLWC